MNKEEFYSIVTKEKIKHIVSKKGTPSYIYFPSIIKYKIDELKKCIPEQLKIYYAIKANPNEQIVKQIHDFGLGADASSMQELKVALKSGIPANSIEFSGPGKTEQELSFAVNAQISSINVECLTELNRLREISKTGGKFINVGLRLNINPKRLRAGVQMGGDSQFGMHERYIEPALNFIKANPKHFYFQGIHVHSGSQLLFEDSIIQNFKEILDLALKIDHMNILPIKKIDFGGGWGINYFPNQKKLNSSKLKDELEKLIGKDKYSNLLQHSHLITEPGRFLVAECGVYVTKVLYKKKSITKQFLIVDGGMHQNYVLAGGMGQVIRRNYEIDVLHTTKKGNANSKKYDIAGCLCTPQDILAINYEAEQEVVEGDYIVFFNSGAYGFSASPLKFLSHSLPAEFVIS